MIRIAAQNSSQGIRFDCTPEDLPRLLADEEWRVWIDLLEPSSEELAILRDVFHFHPLTIEDTQSTRQPPKLEEHDGYIFLITHGVHPESSVSQFRTRRLALFVSDRYVVTVHVTKLRAPDDAWARLQQDGGALLASGTDFLLHFLLDGQVDRYVPFLEQYEPYLETLEDRIFHRPTSSLIDEILATKKALLRLRRISGHQSALLQRLCRGNLPMIGDRSILYLRDVHDHMLRVCELADAFRDVASGALEGYVSSVSLQLNQTMRVLTVFAAIFIPLTFIAGVYGMNFTNMPELQWHYGYFVALGLMAAVGLALWGYFRRKGFL